VLYLRVCHPILVAAHIAAEIPLNGYRPTAVLRYRFGWTTATSPNTGLLIGYIWRTADYCWFSNWRQAQHGRPSARGMEFGTTGVHQPFEALAQQPRVLGRPTFDFLDAGMKRTRSYFMFLARLPEDGSFARGVGRVVVEATERRVVLHARNDSAVAAVATLRVDGFPEFS
jgi:hypothetical protein